MVPFFVVVCTRQRHINFMFLLLSCTKIFVFIKHVATISFGSALFNCIIGWSEQTLKYNLNTSKAHTDGLEVQIRPNRTASWMI